MQAIYAQFERADKEQLENLTLTQETLNEFYEYAHNQILAGHVFVNDWTDKPNYLVYNDDSYGMSCKQIGDLMGLSGERIRKIEEKALRKLKYPTKSKILRSFLEN